MTPELPVVGCPLPAAEPTAAPTPVASPPPAARPWSPEQPVVEVAEPPVVPAPSPAVDVVAEPVVPVALPSPVPVAPPVTAPTGVPVVSSPAPAAQGLPVTSVVPSAYAVVVLGVIGLALLLSFLSGLRPRGGAMHTTRTRLWVGLGTIGVAATIGGIGWYRIAGEPFLNRQVPLLASAGIAVVVLAVLGGALIVAEQLRADQSRIQELEDAVRALTETLAPLVEQPARRQDSDVLLQ